MRVKIFGVGEFNAEDQPIMLILEEGDKDRIAKMSPEATKYCQYDANKYDLSTIDRWMA